MSDNKRGSMMRRKTSLTGAKRRRSLVDKDPDEFEGKISLLALVRDQYVRKLNSSVTRVLISAKTFENNSTNYNPHDSKTLGDIFQEYCESELDTELTGLCLTIQDKFIGLFELESTEQLNSFLEFIGNNEKIASGKMNNIQDYQTNLLLKDTKIILFTEMNNGRLINKFIYKHQDKLGKGTGISQKTDDIEPDYIEVTWGIYSNLAELLTHMSKSDKILNTLKTKNDLLPDNHDFMAMNTQEMFQNIDEFLGDDMVSHELEEYREYPISKGLLD